jgi:hypothetical protein
MFTGIQKNILAHMCICMYIYIYMCVCVCIHIYIYIYIYMHAYIYTHNSLQAFKRICKKLFQTSTICGAFKIIKSGCLCTDIHYNCIHIHTHVKFVFQIKLFHLKLWSLNKPWPFKYEIFVLKLDLINWVLELSLALEYADFKISQCSKCQM